MIRKGAAMYSTKFNQISYEKQREFLENADLVLLGMHDTDALLDNPSGADRNTIDGCNHGAKLYEVDGGAFYLVEIADADEQAEFNGYDRYDEAQAGARELLLKLFIKKPTR